MGVLRFGASIAVCAIAATALRAQCPDGTPPPCRATRVASAPHRVDPPLDDRTWIVVPFTNVTRAADVEWLSDASVNLLSLDLSRWDDIHVVDEGRVADLARLVPEAQTRPLSLVGATAMARRAGAGMLVTGSVVKQGARTTLIAKVFDVGRGSPVRSVQEDLTVQDSLMMVFGRLAERILNVSAPAGVDIANVGTSRLDAYQEYLAGTKALNRFNLTGAKPHFEQALKLDSTFALAHYGLALVAGWESTDAVSQAAAAERLSGSLPSRVRALIKGYSAFAHGQYGSACETYAALVKSDSSDVDAQYGLGECSYHDDEVVVSSGGTTRVFRGSYNTAIRAFQRALAVDPTYFLAFPHITGILMDPLRYGRGLPCETANPCLYLAFVRRDHDTLITVPLKGALGNMADSAGYAAQADDYVKSGAKRRNLEQALAVTQTWLEAAPNENHLHGGIGRIYLALGDARKAEEEFAQVNSYFELLYLSERAQALLKLGRTKQLRLLLDSALVSKDRHRNPRTLARLGVLIGRFALHDSVWNERTALAAYSNVVVRAIVGGGDDVVGAGERAYIDTMRTTLSWSDTTPSQLPTFLAALRMPRTWPPTAYPKSDHLGAIVVAVAHGDTTRLRAETNWLDSAVVSQSTRISGSGASIILADALLVLHDSANALRVVQRALDSTWIQTDLIGIYAPAINAWEVLFAWPRMALLRADLESAVGSKAVARVWYQRFLDLWLGADPEFAPMVMRARRGLAALDGRDVSPQRPRLHSWPTG